MIVDALLAYAHFIAILSMVVFVSSQAALCRPEWLNAAGVARLVGVNRVYLVAAGVTLATGLARAQWGLKGPDWAWAQPMLYVKIGLFALMVGLAVRPTRTYARWARSLAETGVLPDADEIRATRRAVMAASHLMLLLPLAAVLLARGVLGR